jgi:hypothetical protein
MVFRVSRLLVQYSTVFQSYLEKNFINTVEFFFIAKAHAGWGARTVFGVNFI